MTDDPLSGVTVDPLVCHGLPCLKGTRIPVSVVLDCLSDDMTIDEIVDQYPSLTAVAVRAAASWDRRFHS